MAQSDGLAPPEHVAGHRPDLGEHPGDGDLCPVSRLHHQNMVKREGKVSGYCREFRDVSWKGVKS